MTGRICSPSMAAMFITVLLLTLWPDPVKAHNHRILNISHGCQSLSPSQAMLGRCYTLLSNLFEGLTRVGVDGFVEPGAADRWEWDLPEKTLTFYLKSDRFWSDGEPLVATDFVSGWSMILSGDPTQSPFYSTLNKIAGADKCEPFTYSISPCAAGLVALDEYTLRVTFDIVDRLLPFRALNAGMAPVPTHFIKETQSGYNWWEQPGRPFNGAYTLHSDSIVDENTIFAKPLLLELNKWYPEKSERNIKEVTAEFLSKNDLNDSVMGESPYHIMSVTKYLQAPQRSYLERNGWNVLDHELLSVLYIILNRAVVPREIVEAVKLLVYSEEFTSRLGVDSGFLPTKRLFNHPNALEPFESDYAHLNKKQRAEIAKAKLTKLGVSQENPYALNIYDSVKINKRAAAILQATLAPYGINIEMLDVGGHIGDPTQEDKESWPALYLRWYVALPDPSGFFISLKWAGAQVFEPEDQREFDRLLLLSSESSVVERLEYMHEAEELLVNKGAVALMAKPVFNIVYDERLCGVVSSTTAIIPLQWLSWCDDVHQEFMQ